MAALFLLCLSFSSAVLPARALHVKELHQNLVLAKGGRLSVDETVTVDMGKSTRPDFYRFIPTLYKRSGKLCSDAVYVKSVSDGRGQKLPFKTKSLPGFEQIEVGDGRTMLSGVHTYRLSYDVINSVNFVGGRPELFYSALGREWDGPIDKVTISMALSPEQSKLASNTIAYVGNFGGKRHARTKFGAAALNVACEKLAANQDLLVVVPLPQQAVANNGLPAAVNEVYETSQIAVLLPAGTLAMLFLLWLLIGSDQRLGKPPVFTLGAPWQPPAELTPAEMGSILDESCDDKDIFVTVFDLAARGYLMIRETPNHGGTGYGSKDYEFSQPPQPVQGFLKTHEELFMNVIFSGRNKVYLSDMPGYLIDYLPVLRKQILQGLTKDKFFARDPQADRDYFAKTGSCILAVGASLYAYSIFVSNTYQLTSYGLIISGLLIFVSSGVMPKRTRKGVGAIAQAHAFEHFILHAKDSEIDEAARLEPAVFERLLPYAMVLGMAEFWAARFKHLVKQAPDWYITIEQEVGADVGFDTEVLVNELLAAMTAMRHVATTRAEHKSAHHSSSPPSSRYLP
jgi:hypothetical protein